MGMAASQARYLELTARKTNVEFQGQQINQQRTELANESAGMFTQLMALQVPTAPSSTNYTTITSTFNDGDHTNTITNTENIVGDPQYNANVTYSYTQSVYTGLLRTRNDLGVVNEGTAAAPVYWLTNGSTTNPINQVQLSRCNASDTNYAQELAAVKQICKDNSTSQFATDVGYNPGTGDITDITQAYCYTANGTTYFYGATALGLMPPSGAASPLTAYYASDIDKQFTKTELAYVTRAESGRLSTIRLENQGNTSFNVSTTTTTDQNAYQDALNEYEYQQMSYQQQVNNINAKTSAIQAEDRALELQLRQLDTEQKALSTELDSVKKVIEKNIESTFKTFQ